MPNQPRTEFDSTVAQSKQPGHEMRVLVAEDDTVTNKVLQRALQRLGFAPDSVPDGSMAWQAIQSTHYSIVVTDWMMPEVEGTELCRLIRGMQDRPYTYIIMLTARGEREDRIEAMRFGADDVLNKPLDLEELKTRMDVAVRILTMEQKLKAQNDELTEARTVLQEASVVLERQREETARALKHAENSKSVAEAANRRFEQLFGGLPVAGFTLDKDLTVFEWNRKAEETFLVTADCAVHKPLVALLGNKLVNKKAREALKSVFLGNPFVDEEWTSEGCALLVCGYPLQVASGEVTGCLCTAVDITELRSAEAKLREQCVQLKYANKEIADANDRLSKIAVTDGLTGIPNHRALIDRLRELNAAADRGDALSVIMIDVDFFKRFNDEFGHRAGDEVLVAVAETLRAGIRKSDFVARYGGEEFCILLPGAGQQIALQLADRLRTALMQIETPYRQITASFGVTTHPGHPVGEESLIKTADAALYDAKAAGRNRVVTRNFANFEAA